MGKDCSTQLDPHQMKTDLLKKRYELFQEEATSCLKKNKIGKLVHQKGLASSKVQHPK